ncbi:hypothetical protein OIDMADRAFT_118740 [Oidiodendron maius Zn]|uniref:Ubiquitin 3 binding protein But2 C-terminal domain-containing protein n=1 Tax=Oidiodendron maius (strain Zn) TaxID=913774 RepID=A0A0C3CV10_OIDMZ|nr:hypothetical protein OIDMADRAFT_118740 [Oidiodendron maius Zn]
MFASTTTFALLSLLGLSAAAPTPVELAPRCGSLSYPVLLQQFSEAHPTTVYPNTHPINGDFHVSREMDPVTGKVSNRISQMVMFKDIPAGSYGCQLNVAFPANYPITTTGNPVLNVYTFYSGTDPAYIPYPNNWSWDTFYPRSETNPAPFGEGVFGTINFAPGQTTVINSEACPYGGGDVAFVFEIADWVWGSASIEFEEYSSAILDEGKAGVYLTYDC